MQSKSSSEGVHPGGHSGLYARPKARRRVHAQQGCGKIVTACRFGSFAGCLRRDGDEAALWSTVVRHMRHIRRVPARGRIICSIFRLSRAPWWQPWSKWRARRLRRRRDDFSCRAVRTAAAASPAGPEGNDLRVSGRRVWPSGAHSHRQRHCRAADSWVLSN